MRHFCIWKHIYLSLCFPYKPLTLNNHCSKLLPIYLQNCCSISMLAAIVSTQIFDRCLQTHLLTRNRNSTNLFTPENMTVFETSNDTTPYNLIGPITLSLDFRSSMKWFTFRCSAIVTNFVEVPDDGFGTDIKNLLLWQWTCSKDNPPYFC